MSLWELFTWINAAVLGVGSVIVFVLFLKQVKNIVPPRRSGREDNDPG